MVIVVGCVILVGYSAGMALHPDVQRRLTRVHEVLCCRVLGTPLVLLLTFLLGPSNLGTVGSFLLGSFPHGLILGKEKPLPFSPWVLRNHVLICTLLEAVCPEELSSWRSFVSIGLWRRWRHFGSSVCWRSWWYLEYWY